MLDNQLKINDGGNDMHDAMFYIGQAWALGEIHIEKNLREDYKKELEKAFDKLSEVYEEEMIDMQYEE